MTDTNEKIIPDNNLNLIDEIKNEARESLRKTMWNKPASDIITGINNNSNVQPNRAIWELVQNARDVSHEGGKAEIIFTRRLNEFEFQHNGQPFTRESLQGLILQTSSKVRHDIVQVGQYGTGFLTTHKFGLRFNLYGSLQLLKGRCFYNFNEFEIDRSSNDTEILSGKLYDQIELTQKWGEDVSTHMTSPAKYTRFVYMHDYEIEKQYVKAAFEKSPELAPYVLALNKHIQSITFSDEVADTKEIFSYVRTELEYEAENIMVSGVQILHNGNINTLYLLQSKKLIEEKTKESKVTIILPVKKNPNGVYEIFSFSEHTPQLYLYLPLLGSTQWGLNYQIHAPHFTCDKDTRDTLLFVGNGQNNDYLAEKNQELIKIANSLIREYLDLNYSTFVNPKYLAKVNFNVNLPEKLSLYYQSLQKEWVSYYESLNLVTKKKDNSTIKVDCIKVLDIEMYQACTDDMELLDAVYDLLSKEDHKLTLPDKEDLVYWSQTIGEWYAVKENPHIITVNDLASLIEKTSINNTDLTWLHKLCDYFKKHKHGDFFQKTIVPNEDFILTIQKDLFVPAQMNQTLRSVLKTLRPEEVKKFVHAKFIDIVDEDVNPFGDAEIKKILLEYINQLPSKSEILKNEIIASPEEVDLDKYKDACLTTDAVHAILDLYKMLLSESATGFASRIFTLLTEYYNYYPITIDVLNKEVFDIRSCYNLLINDALLNFTLTVDKSNKTDWCLRMVKELKNFSDANSFLRNYQVYPDQFGEYKYAVQLKKEEDNIPPRLKEIYDIIIRGVTQEDTTKSIGHDLVDSKFAPYFIELGIQRGKELADQIQKPFENGMPSIDKNPHQKLFIEIIEKFSNSETGTKWKELFNIINTHKATMMLSIMDNPLKKESIFSIMKVQEESKLKILAELAQNEQFDRIVELSRKLIEQEERNNNDFLFKKMLGEYVEEFLLKQLATELGESKLTIPAPVRDEQGGQDLIVYLNDTPFYYIEVKSRWESEQSVLMSTMQHKRSFKEKDHYALCAVNMIGYDKELAKKHEYPDIRNIIDRISVVDNIGVLNDRLQDAVVENKAIVYVASGYQVLVSQDVIKDNKKPFLDFVTELKENIRKTISA